MPHPLLFSPAKQAPLSAGDKFLAMLGFLLSALIVYRVDRAGGIIMVVILLALIFRGCRGPGGA
jgi:hypothetical protein